MKPTELAQALIDKLLSPGAVAVGLAFQEVYYGEPTTLPKLPAACVTVEDHTKTISNMAQPPRTDESVIVNIYVYHAGWGDQHFRQKEADQLVELVATFLEQDSKLGNTIIFGYVPKTQPTGAMRIGNKIYLTSRLTWTGRYRSYIGA